MKKTIVISAVIIGAFILLYFVGKPEQPADVEKLENLPWQIIIEPDGNTSVLSITLMKTTLQDLVTRYRRPNGLALFENDNQLTLEAYFKSITVGPLSAKLIVTLDATPEQAEGMRARASSRSGTASGATKWLLSTEDQKAAMQRTVSSITFIPAYKGMDAAYLKERLGEPTAWKRLNEHIVRWFYADLGLELAIDAEGQELFIYRNPASFVIPEDATYVEDNVANTQAENP